LIASLRYQLAKLVTAPGVDRLRTTNNTNEALAIVRMIYTLTIDSDKATALIGAEMATIPALLHFMATSNSVVTADLQVQSAITLASLAAGNSARFSSPRLKFFFFGIFKLLIFQIKTKISSRLQRELVYYSLI